MHGLFTQKMIFWKSKIITSGEINDYSPIMCNNLTKGKNKAKNPKSVSLTQPETKNILGFYWSSPQTFLLSLLQLPYMLLSALTSWFAWQCPFWKWRKSKKEVSIDLNSGKLKSWKKEKQRQGQKRILKVTSSESRTAFINIWHYLDDYFASHISSDKITFDFTMNELHSLARGWNLA